MTVVRYGSVPCGRCLGAFRNRLSSRAIHYNDRLSGSRQRDWRSIARNAVNAGWLYAMQVCMLFSVVRRCISETPLVGNSHVLQYNGSPWMCARLREPCLKQLNELPNGVTQTCWWDPSHRIALSQQIGRCSFSLFIFRGPASVRQKAACDRTWVRMRCCRPCSRSFSSLAVHTECTWLRRSPGRAP